MTPFQRCLYLIVALGSGFIGSAAVAGSNNTALRISPRCGTDATLFVVTGDRLPALLGVPITKISLHKADQSGLTPISHQIDQRDEHNRYQIDDADQSSSQSRKYLLDENDEVIVKLSDIGRRLTSVTNLDTSTAIEIELKDNTGRPLGWVYARTDSNSASSTFEKLIEYDSGSDSVTTSRYFIGFSRKTPFIIDTLKWPLKDQAGWSSDVLDTMKLHHRGKLFKVFNFKRSHDDYWSEIVGVKEGPLRIIRRTKNQVRIIWKLKSPKVYVDYVMAPDGFVMDTIIDIPFKIGLFFSDVDTLSTIDWDDNPGYPTLKVASLDGQFGFDITGDMDTVKNNFNQSNDEGFSMHSDLGSMRTRMLIPDDFPIKRWLYITDEKLIMDPPEQIKGQYGNIGFRTTDWEKIDTKIYHLKYDVCIQ